MKFCSRTRTRMVARCSRRVRTCLVALAGCSNQVCSAVSVWRRHESGAELPSTSLRRRQVRESASCRSTSLPASHRQAPDAGGSARSGRGPLRSSPRDLPLRAAAAAAGQERPSASSTTSRSGRWSPSSRLLRTSASPGVGKGRRGTAASRQPERAHKGLLSGQNAGLGDGIQRARPWSLRAMAPGNSLCAPTIDGTTNSLRPTRGERPVGKAGR